MRVGTRIKDRRTELDWTQDDLARKAGISKGFLSDLENGKRSVGADTLYGIARALGLSLDFLMKGSGEKEDASLDIQIPSRLVEVAKLENLSFTKTLTLLDMRLQIIAHRSASKSESLEDFDWRGFYNSVKDYI
jgi:transcriptional regulator with XRE-family HTH domain